jgi:arsenate reductase
MAEGILKSIDPNLEVYSAGVMPASKISSKTVTVMEEIGIDISGQYPKSVENFLDNKFDYVITVCDNAKETCPVFTGKVKHRLHFGFEDPYSFIGTEDETLNKYREVRDSLAITFKKFYNNILGDSHGNK